VTDSTPVPPQPAVPEPAAAVADQAWVPIAIAGELDLYSAPSLREQVLKAVNAGQLHLVLDLSGVTFVDSSGFAVMVSAYKRARALGGQMRVCCADRQVSSAMRISGLDRVFEVFPDLAAATAQPPGQPPPVGSDGTADG
jgi:anti-sigma B factor antagonist